jgi:hypothetical protein
MGCFDYECECGGTTCVFVGGQNGGDSDVIIEVPLNDGTTVYVKGRYESYGSVHVGNYQFYPEQFEEYFKGWLSSESDESRSRIFRAGKIWTMLYSHYNYDDEDDYETCRKKASNCQPKDIMIITRLGKNTLRKCIRADEGLNILTDEQRKAKRAEELASRIASMQKELSSI